MVKRGQHCCDSYVGGCILEKMKYPAMLDDVNPTCWLRLSRTALCFDIYKQPYYKKNIDLKLDFKAAFEYVQGEEVSC